MTEYWNAAQYVLDHGIANKLVNRIKLHHQTYKRIREQSDLNSQLVINAADLLVSLTTFQPVTLSSTLPVRYDDRSASIYPDKCLVSLATTASRIDVKYTVPKCYEQYTDWKYRSFELVKQDERFFLHLVVQKTVPASDRPTTMIPVYVKNISRQWNLITINRIYRLEIHY